MPPWFVELGCEISCRSRFHGHYDVSTVRSISKPESSESDMFILGIISDLVVVELLYRYRRLQPSVTTTTVANCQPSGRLSDRNGASLVYPKRSHTRRVCRGFSVKLSKIPVPLKASWEKRYTKEPVGTPGDLCTHVGRGKRE